MSPCHEQHGLMIVSFLRCVLRFHNKAKVITVLRWWTNSWPSNIVMEVRCASGLHLGLPICCLHTDIHQKLCSSIVEPHVSKVICAALARLDVF
jgi:hypothetical protein